MEGSESSDVEDNLLLRWKTVFVDPERSFVTIVGRERAVDWFFPVLLSCIVGIVYFYLTIDLVDAGRVDQPFESMNEEQIKEYEEWSQKGLTYGWTLIPVGHFTSLVVVAVLLMAIVRMAFQMELSFRQALIVKAHATLIVIPEWIVLILIILLTGSSQVSLGPGLLLDDGYNSYVGRFLTGINIFDAWQIWVLSAGVAVFANIQRRRVLVVLGVIWFLWLFGAAALEGLVEKIQIEGSNEV